MPPTTPKKSKTNPKSTPKSRGKKGKVATEAPPDKDLNGLEFDEDIDLGGGFKKEELDDDLI
jgi:hypothetical protein